jgi:hypothetical protein
MLQDMHPAAAAESGHGLFPNSSSGVLVTEKDHLDPQVCHFVSS